MTQRSNYKIAIDIFWYLAGTSIPMLTLLVRSPIYTRIFSPEEYGYYSLVHVTYTYLATVQFSWLINSCWRFYLNYKKEQKLKALNSVLLSLFSVSSLVLLIIMLVWARLSGNALNTKLVVYGFFFFFSQESLNLLLVPMRIEGYAKKYNLIHSSRALLSFGLLLYLTFEKDFRIEAFYISGCILNAAYLLPIGLGKLLKKPFGFSLFQKSDFTEIFRYGISGLLLNVFILILISSDRYIIALFYSKSEVGIYNQIYNLGQISLAAIINVYLNAINPDLLNTLEHNRNHSSLVLKRFLYILIYLFFPLAILLSVFSKELAFIMLGPDFRVAWYIIPYIMFSSLVYGMCHFSMMLFRFENKLRILVTGGAIAAGVNIVLNFMVIPSMNYTWAAYTTLIAYVIMFMFYNLNDTTYFFRDRKYLKAVFLMTILLLIMITIKILLHFYHVVNTIPVSVAEGIAYLAVFYLLTLKLNPFYSRSKYA